MAKRHRRHSIAKKREIVEAYLADDAPRRTFRSFVNHFPFS